MEQENKQENRFEETMIEGRNAVLEAFRSGKTVDKLFVLDGCQDGPVKTITREAKKQNTIIHYVAKERLDQLSETGKHQGVIAQAAAYRRGRNAKSFTMPKHATMKDYRMATGFEALMGYLYLTEQFDRMAELLGKGLEQMGELISL